jgi:hypothetical protein
VSLGPGYADCRSDILNQPAWRGAPTSAIRLLHSLALTGLSTAAEN